MACKYIVGSGHALPRAVAAWRALAPGVELREIAIPAGADQAAMQALLGGLDPEDASAFVAADAYFLNFYRLELMSIVRGLGIPMPPLVEPGAVVAGGVRLLDNTWVGAGAILQPGCRIGFNAVIGPGAIVGGGADIGQSAYVEAGVVVGHGAKIGAKATLGLGVSIGHGVEIGALCVIDRPGRIEADVAARTFIQTSHAHPMVIVGA